MNIKDSAYDGIGHCQMIRRKDNLDIKHHVRVCKLVVIYLLRDLNTVQKMCKTCLFHTYCTSLYGGICSGASTASHKKAKVAYNDIYRGLFNVEAGVIMSMIYMFSDIDALDVIVRKYIFSFQARISRSSTVIII